jgi:hypothetical protein
MALTVLGGVAVVAVAGLTMWLRFLLDELGRPGPG